MQPFTLLIKPSGSDCNLDCSYCFYKNRPSQIGTGRQRMSEQVLEQMIKDYMALGFTGAGFAWQGGEPTLMGLDFYRKAVELQNKYRTAGQIVENSLQTNAVLFDDQWCQFLHDNNFLVGISIDGPKEIHDYYRIDHAGGGTFDKVVWAIDLCKKHKVEFNVLILVNDKNVGHPQAVVDFLLDKEIKFLQFIPCYETDASGKVADFSVRPQQYGEFLCRVFDIWQKNGPANLSIRDFDSVLNYLLIGRHTVCTFDRQCSAYIVIEHNGDAFCCDFFVRPKWRLGNILETNIGELAGSVVKKNFANAKCKLSNRCLICRHLSICRGGCMKDRIIGDNGDFAKESYFCPAYKQFFDYTLPKFRLMAANIKASIKPVS